MRRLVASTVLLPLVPALLSAQLVRGTVKAADGTPIPGAVVTLLGANGTVASRAVVRPNGFYEVRAPGDGKWQLLLDHAGSKTFLVNPVEVSGLVTQYPIVAAFEPRNLGRLPLSTPDVCRLGLVLDGPEREVWDAVRTDLTALVLAENGRLLMREIHRAKRSWDVAHKRLASEQPQPPLKVNERPFITPSADSLAKSGYVHGDSTYFTFEVPDARVFLSDAFAAKHCFRYASSRTHEGREEVGLAFQPAPKPSVVEIEGTFWLDRETGVLASMEFRYTPPPAEKGSFGGEHRYAQSKDGIWYVKQWLQELPRFAVRPTGQNRAFLTSDRQLREVMAGEMTVAGIEEEAGDATPVP